MFVTPLLLQNRIEKSQGKVVIDDVGRGMVNGRLAMTRSIGDLELKPFGVTAVPDIRKIKASRVFLNNIPSVILFGSQQKRVKVGPIFIFIHPIFFLFLF